MYKMCEYCINESSNCSLEDLQEEEKLDLIITRCKNYNRRCMTVEEIEHVFKLARDYNTDVKLEYATGDKATAYNSSLEDVLEFIINNKLAVINAYTAVEVQI